MYLPMEQLHILHAVTQIRPWALPVDGAEYKTKPLQQKLSCIIFCLSRVVVVYDVLLVNKCINVNTCTRLFLMSSVWDSE